MIPIEKYDSNTDPEIWAKREVSPGDPGHGQGLREVPSPSPLAQPGAAQEEKAQHVEQADDGRRKERHDQIRSQTKAIVVSRANPRFPEPASSSLFDSVPVQPQYRNDCSRLDTDCVGVGGFAFGQAHDSLGENQVAG